MTVCLGIKAELNCSASKRRYQVRTCYAMVTNNPSSGVTQEKLISCLISLTEGSGDGRGRLFIKITEQTKLNEAPSWHLLPTSSWPEMMAHHPG